jgi:hypothetical protein
MKDEARQKYEWYRGEELIASLEIDDSQGMKLIFACEMLARIAGDLQDLMSLSMYPPKDEDRVSGVPIMDGKYTEYEIKKGTKWEMAKIDMANTFRFWFADEAKERAV